MSEEYNITKVVPMSQPDPNYNLDILEEVAKVQSSQKAVPISAIGKLRIQFPAGVKEGTAFLIGNNVLATAGHCIKYAGNGGKSSAISVVLGGTKYYVKSAYVSKKWNSGETWQDDYGALILTETPGRTLGYLDYNIASATTLTNLAVSVYGYREYQTALTTSTGKISIVSANDLQVSCTPQPGLGMSGGAMVSKINASDYFVGIYNYGANGTYLPSGARITTTIADFLDNPTGLGYKIF